MTDAIESNKKQKKLIIRISLLLVVLTFFVIYLRDLNLAVLKNVQITPLFLVISATFSLAFRYLGVCVWKNILNDLGSGNVISFPVLALIYAKAWMARYIPGTVTWLAGKVWLAKGLGISKSRLTAATMAELGAQIVAVSIVSLVLINFHTKLEGLIAQPIRWLAMVMVFALLLLLVPAIFNRVIHTVFRCIMRRDASPELSINNRAAIRAMATYAFGAFLSGAVYYFLALALGVDLCFQDFLFVVGAANLAGVIGMITPFVPSGLGTRDASMMILFSAVMPKELAVVLTVASRAWTAVVDLGFLGSAWLLSGREGQLKLKEFSALLED